ncbi:MAG: hypothetical protein K2Q34_00380 [Alphaproteobacteria bacterium]|nr:hypothetical protein [Alphaproteobacteria bacterium]
MKSIQKPLLSVVATSRNDDHGGNALWRTQHFVNGLAAQALKFEFPIELLLVDWNPPANKKGLFEALDWPKKNAYFSYRVIQVPNEYHTKFKFSDKLPLFQYIAKNVGIRRASADYILSTNIDILFSNELMEFLKTKLKPGCLYRVDRYDTDLKDTVSPFEPFQTVLEKADQGMVRVNMKVGTFPFNVHIKNNFMYKGKFFICMTTVSSIFRIVLSYSKKVLRKTLFAIKAFPNALIKSIIHPIRACKSAPDMLKKLRVLWMSLAKDAKSFFKYVVNVSGLLFRSTNFLHTNACGDFTLISKDDWEKLKGYPEWELYSWHIDSVLIYQAYHNSIIMNNLPPSHAIYHIEHGQGSGWTPEGANLLFDRLKKQGIAYMSDDDLANEFEKQRNLKAQGEPVVYNDDNWGAPHVQFPEKDSLIKA